MLDKLVCKKPVIKKSLTLYLVLEAQRLRRKRFPKTIQRASRYKT